MASKRIPQLTGAERGVKLVNVKKGEASVFRAVRSREQSGIINEKNREKVVDPKHYRAMTRGSVRLRKLKAVKFVWFSLFAGMQGAPKIQSSFLGYDRLCHMLPHSIVYSSVA